MKTKRILAIAAAAVMTVSLAACGGGGNSGSTGSTGSAAVKAPDDIWAPYEETVTVTVVGEENSGTAFQGDDDYQHNPWYQAYKDRFNIDLQNLWISNDYTTKLNLSIADGDLPDVFHVDSNQLTQLHDAGMIMNLDDVFERYASDTLKGYRKDNADTWATGEFDGSLYGIPQMSYGPIDQFQYVWIRQDWMQECGFEAPTTMDEVLTIAKTFAEKYGGYGLAENQNLDNLMRTALAYGAHPGIWVRKDDGSIEYGTIQPEMKTALEHYRDWYQEGILKSDFVTMDNDKMFQSMINGECGVIFFAQWFGYNPLPDLIANNGPEAIFYPYEIPSETGSKIMGSVTFNNNGYVVINKNCQNPEAVMKIVNFFPYMMDDAVEAGETHEFISSLYDNNYPNIVFPTRVINPMTDYNQFVQVKAAVDKWLAGEEVDTSDLGKNVSKFNSCVAWNTSQDVNGVGDWLQQGNDRSAYGISKVYLDEGQYVKDAMWGAPTPTLQAAGSTLNDILIEGFTKIIVGEKDIDYFDELVEQWKTAGGSQATQEINDTYGK